MKFNSSTTINAPREQVVQLFMDRKLLAEHQDGFIKKDLISGDYGQDGSVSKIYFKQGKGQMELTETIQSNQLPDSIETFIHHEHMDNNYKCSFIDRGDQTTEYKVEGEYVTVRGFMPKMMMKLFPGMFRKQSEKWMVNFKNFVENYEQMG